MDEKKGIGAKRLQRQLFLAGLVVAAIPILCQILMFLAIRTAPDAFPSVDRSLGEPRFWAIQIVLLCVAVAGSAIVDCVKILLIDGRIERTALIAFLVLLLCFFLEAIMFSITLLASQIGWAWLSGSAVLGGLNLGFAFLLEMEIAKKA